jgi:hypothetical protein
MAVEKITFYQHDLKPDMTMLCERETSRGSGVFVAVPLEDPGGDPLTEGIRVIGIRQDNTKVFERRVDEAGYQEGLKVGRVRMEWEPGDTAEIGLLRVEVEVMWPGGKPETFRPNQGYNIVSDFDALANITGPQGQVPVSP